MSNCLTETTAIKYNKRYKKNHNKKLIFEKKIIFGNSRFLKQQNVICKRMKWARLKKFSPWLFFIFFASNTALLNYFCLQIFEFHENYIFLSISKNQQICEVAISLIYQLIFKNLGIKWIGLTKEIQWSKLQSNISINKDIHF